jgi:RNA polymerase sigma-70 factor (ECF subfamily)
MNDEIPPPTSHNADHMRQIARLWTQALPAVSALIGATVIDFHDAEDLLGQVAETVVTKACDYDPQRPFIPWAMGIARYRILQYFERRRTDRHVGFDDETLGLLADAHCELAEEAPARLAALRQCLGQLQGKSKRVLDMRYLHDHRSNWIAEKMGMTPGAVWTLLHRARKALAECIDRRLAANTQGGER